MNKKVGVIGGGRVGEWSVAFVASDSPRLQ